MTSFRSSCIPQTTNHRLSANCSLSQPTAASTFQSQLRERRRGRRIVAVGGDEGEPPVDDGGDGDEQDDDEIVVDGRAVGLQLLLPGRRRPRLLLLLPRRRRGPLTLRCSRCRPLRWGLRVGAFSFSRGCSMSLHEALSKFL